MIPASLRNKVIKVESIEHGKEVIAFWERVGAGNTEAYTGQGNYYGVWSEYALMEWTNIPDRYDLITLSQARALWEQEKKPARVGPSYGDRLIDDEGLVLYYIAKTTAGRIIASVTHPDNIVNTFHPDHIHPFPTITVTHAEIAEWKGCSVEQLEIKP